MAIWSNGVSSDDVYFYFKETYNIDENTHYKQDNWVKRIQPQKNSIGWHFAIHEKINVIQWAQGAIWLTSNGDICYRLSPLGKVHTASISKINLIFSNFLDCNFRISQTIPKIIIPNEQIEQLKNENKFILYINQLLLIEAEEFNPHIEEEFYKNRIDGLIYRNTFKPSFFLQIYPELPKKIYKKDIEVGYSEQEANEQQWFYLKEIDKSITLQYIYYLCNYKKDRFDWLINWLASFFKNLSNRSNSILILYGSSNSGIDIFFRNIITPLFGEEYTIKITNNTPISKYESKFINEKLFYNISNISQLTTNNEKTTVFLQKLLPENQKYAQVLITTEEPTILYNNINNYTVFHVSRVIDEIYIPDWFNGSDKTKLSRQKLTDLIADDLENFSKILKLYSSNQESNHPFTDDDKNFIINTLEDKLKAFVSAIKKMDMTYFKSIQNHNTNLYKEIQEHFDKQLVKQSNLMEYFNILNFRT